MGDARLLVVLDFEATCDADGGLRPEIIEFPSILYDPDADRVVDEFTAFVRPLEHPCLTAFCRELTGIRQVDVDAAPTFPTVFARHQGWLRRHGLDPYGDDRFAFVTCGDWDLRTMLPRQVRSVGGVVPPAYRSWINIKRVMADRSGWGSARSLPAMLAALDLELVGRHHRGIDDCRNVLAIVRTLLASGVDLVVNGRVDDAPPPGP